MVLSFRAGGKQVDPQLLRHVFRLQLSFDAVSGRVEPWREGAKPALAGRDGDDAATDTDTALSGQADFVEPIARGHVRPAVVIQPACSGRSSGRPRAAGQRVDASMRECRAHHRDVPGGDVQRALPRVKVERLHRVAIDPADAVRKCATPRLRRLASRYKAFVAVLERSMHLRQHH